jgi:hypothetical protein
MGIIVSHSARSFIVIAAVAFFTFTNCQQAPAPANNANNNSGVGASAPSSSQIVIPPWPQGFPQGFPPAVISGNVPLAVPLPAQINSPVQIRPNFDYFSWESFIALNWPAATGSRGVPNQPGNADAFLKAPNGTPVVWGTYKDSFELFGQKDKRPTSWDATDIPVNPCPGGQAGQKTLVFLSKGNTPLMQTSQAFSFPLIDQRNNYVYYDVRYDQAQYNFIRGQDNDPTSWLYLLKNLAPKENAPGGLQMPISSPSPSPTLGAIMVKGAWRIKTDKDDPNRFYTTNAQIYNPGTQTCTQTQVLLVGLHIAHKVDPFSEWVWSSFEQVDNVPPDGTMSPKPSPPPNGYSFNNGTDNPKTVNGYNYKPPQAPSVQPTPLPTPSPVQVTRVNPIPDTPQGASTRDVNAFYQQLLKGTVWQYYQLVITQWPFNPGPLVPIEQGGVYPQGAGGAFPVYGAVNTTMETYFQAQNDAAGAGGNSCMSCHYRAGQSDFSWGLNRRAH